jgi:hypothetical protein
MVITKWRIMLFGEFEQALPQQRCRIDSDALGLDTRAASDLVGQMSRTID